MEIPIVFNFFCDHVKEPGQIFIFHFFAFRVEIKPDQPEVIVSDTHMHLLKIVSHSLLRAFLVDKIQDCAILVVFLDVVVIFAGDFGI